MMNNYWILETRGDPLGTVNCFFKTLWSYCNLEGMLVSQNTIDQSGTGLHLLDEPEQLDQMNPFWPLMTYNAAKHVPASLEEHPQARLGAVLRPCEMRALTEMVKHDSFSIDRLLTICVDCLGTYPVDDVHWRSERKGSLEGLSYEALQFARQGGIVAYRYRSACQMCSAPNSHGADINICVIGLPVRQYLLVEIGDEAKAEMLGLSHISDGKAEENHVIQRDRVIWKLAERHNRTRERVIKGLANLVPSDVDALVKQLHNCGDCQECLNACPICTIDFPKREQDGSYRREDVIRWLVSCSGCGMCEQACVNHLPLSAIFGYIRQQLTQSLEYRPGYSLDEPLPLA